MTRHTWKVADAGVMLWEPAVEAATATALPEAHALEQPDNVAETDIQAGSHDDCEHSNRQDLVLPSLEGFFGSYTKDEPGEDLRSETPLDTSQYASGTTESFSSPCPLFSSKVASTKLHNSSKTSRRLEVSNIKRTPPVRRTLNFGMTNVRKTLDAVPKYGEPSGFDSLAALKRLERDPPHQWDEDERELLTILYRWYNDKDATTLPRTFNAVTDQDLRLSVIRYQFDSHLVLYGPRAYPEFGRVMAVPFHDPMQKYGGIHAIIEEKATEYGINLSRRRIEVKRKSGLAQYAKSPTTRKYWKSLVRRAAERERKMRCVPLAPNVQGSSAQVPPLGGVTLAADVKYEDEENWSDVEDLNISAVTFTQLSPSSLPTTNSIGFRVWDANSRTMFDEETGFVSQAFSIWRGELPPPFSPDGQGRQAIMFLSNLHLSMSGGASAFVSVSTSLLQALVKASTMEDPRIAVVALDHALLQQPHKTLPAADILRMLKAEGQAWWARYKGHAERMVWASVPAAAIISHFPLSKLRQLSNQEKTCEDILSLNEIESGRRTQHVSSQLRDKNNAISVSTSRAMAMVSRIFGMHRCSVSLTHIKGLVSSLVDSFQLEQVSSQSNYTSRMISRAFAVTLRSRAHCIQDIEVAFKDGVEQGTATIAFYARRRRTIKT
ncbi:hypothetical protein GT037_009697 [Alternaria burnsii]|uniref:DUF7587 domain-containing protein n=1 Tax=Alternaria burnsii TaxID=1187904 RepID=A0A8H7EA51_9PLEO|nr:uncharacterized protein GT037_009697 [Alternaria burnsii]KAF7672187.1 hypothetical protein GT037_009697 [Alternaria burnsii]